MMACHNVGDEKRHTNLLKHITNSMRVILAAVLVKSYHVEWKNGRINEQFPLIF